MEPPISYDHPDRLRAIVNTYYGFLAKAGFKEAESRYSPKYLKRWPICIGR